MSPPVVLADSALRVNGEADVDPTLEFGVGAVQHIDSKKTLHLHHHGERPTVNSEFFTTSTAGLLIPTVNSTLNISDSPGNTTYSKIRCHGVCYVHLKALKS